MTTYLTQKLNVSEGCPIKHKSIERKSNQPFDHGPITTFPSIFLGRNDKWDDGKCTSPNELAYPLLDSSQNTFFSFPFHRLRPLV